MLDDRDIGGGAAEADYVRQTKAGPAGLLRKNGRFMWVAGNDAAGAFEAADGTRFDAQVFGNLDVLSLSAGPTPRMWRFSSRLVKHPAADGAKGSHTRF